MYIRGGKNGLDRISVNRGGKLTGDFRCDGMSGSLIQKVNKKQLTAICFIVAVCQLLAMYIGYFLSSFLNGKYSVKDEALLGEIISIGILIGSDQAYRKGYKKRKD